MFYEYHWEKVTGGIVKRTVFVLSLTYPCGWLCSKRAVESRKKLPACQTLEKGVGEFLFTNASSKIFQMI